MPRVYNTDKDKVVGFKKEAEIIIEQLIRGPKERDVVLITGMGGLGKTTLAKRVFDDKRVVNYFDNRAWCSVSQEYHRNELLNKIYSQVCGSETKIDDIAEKLRKSLMGKRYLIVLDDIWSVEAWEELNRVFPSCDNGSRIVLTSRQENVVSDAKKVCLPFFTIDESWELLQLKLFKEERCLEEFEKIGLEIIVDKSILSEVNSLIHLRYLAIQLSGSGFVSPLSLENLQCLVTLKLSSDAELHLPMIFWNTRSLRHMINYHYCGLDCPSKEEETSTIEAIPGSEVLQTLDLSNKLSIRDEHLLRKFPYLKYLMCGVSPSYPFAEIDFLHHLESLNLFCVGDPHLLNDLKLTKFPSSIKELLLRGITLSPSAISIISQLHNLEALILRKCKFEGLEWIVEEETQFPKLKYLELYHIGIYIWNIISAESFPCLEQLILHVCHSLVEVPSSLVDSSTLKLISARGCNPSTKNSVEKIQEGAQDIGNEQLNAEISLHPDFAYFGRF